MTSKLSGQEVKHVAKLANFPLTEGETEKFRQQLSEILEYAEILKKVKTEDVKPSSQGVNLENAFREDKAEPSLSPEEVLSGAKDKQDGMFKVKAIFEE